MYICMLCTCLCIKLSHILHLMFWYCVYMLVGPEDWAKPQALLLPIMASSWTLPTTLQFHHNHPQEEIPILS